MLTADSPLINIPIALDAKQAIFIDGLRHAAQISDLAYKRLCAALKEQAIHSGEGRAHDSFVPIFLDAWAFIDAADRFRLLWELQPSRDTLPDQFSPVKVREKLQGVRDLRNVSDHIAQKIDQIVSLNSSVLGSISWLSLVGESPLQVKTCFIRPGIMRAATSGQLAIPTKAVTFVSGSGCITMAAGKHKALLDDAYHLMCEIVDYAERHLSKVFEGSPGRHPADMIGTADLNTSGSASAI